MKNTLSNFTVWDSIFISQIQNLHGQIHRQPYSKSGNKKCTNEQQLFRTFP